MTEGVRLRDSSQVRSSKHESDITINSEDGNWTQQKPTAVKEHHDESDNFNLDITQPNTNKTNLKSKIYKGLAITVFWSVVFLVVIQVKAYWDGENGVSGTSSAVLGENAGVELFDGTVASPNFARSNSASRNNSRKNDDDGCCRICGGFWGFILFYIVAAIGCSIRWAVCWNIYIKDQFRTGRDSFPAGDVISNDMIDTAVDNDDSTSCIGLWSYIAWGCSPPPFLAPLEDDIGCTFPCFWFMFWEWFVGPWGCCTCKPCKYPWVDKCCGTVYPDEIWDKDAFTKDNIAATGTALAAAVAESSIGGSVTFNNNFVDGLDFN